jgi:hypothetical protein
MPRQRGRHRAPERAEGRVSIPAAEGPAEAGADVRRRPHVTWIRRQAPG